MKYELQQCIASRLRRLSRITDNFLRKELMGFNITENQLNILFLLSKSGKVEQGEIGKKLSLERSTVSRNVRLLEKQKYIRRTTDYRPEIELTGKGKELVKTLIPVWEKFMDDILNKLGNDGIKLIEKLEKKFN